MSDAPIQVPSVHYAKGFVVNLSPLAFRKWARQYFQCAQLLLSASEFSPVPYFLLCRAIELAVKAGHLEFRTQKHVKAEFGHDLLSAYDALPIHSKNLDSAQRATLAQASAIYKSKGFEYFDPEDALSGYSQFPELGELEETARKLVVT